MGVPAFFRWLTKNYPSVIIECAEDRNFTDEGGEIPQDTSKPNPNGIEFDNLYLDMNGIIHPCTHPEDKPAPKNEDEMMVAIFECIDRIFSIVRPRKLLYMAIDGVAPRAKMNQQRSRRFRASKEAEEKRTQINLMRAKLEEAGYKLPPPKPKEQHFDSNCITPGTPFMDRLSKCLHYYIHDRLNNDAGWRNIKVILSDANVPGEGEHKIMEYIRKQRAQPDHDPNTHHVLCGADADLIMLGLATHEVNFTIIREEFKPNAPKPCELCGQLGHDLDQCVGLPDGTEAIEDKTFGSETKYIFVRLNVLREYLEEALNMPHLPFKYDFERAVDDWVFMCFFVGNDFLPHLPCLSIHENAIHVLVRIYKNCCFQTGGWLTDSGTANLERVQVIMEQLAAKEDEIFVNRNRRELQFRARNKEQKERERRAAEEFRDSTARGSLGIMKAGESSVAHGAKQLIMDQRMTNMEKRGEKRKIDQVDDDEVQDEVKLHESGYRNRYYESKFETSTTNADFRKLVANEYARGLCWVLKYYYQGCASWDWYYPYHYAPFAADFYDCANANVKFNLGEPFAPMEQLMSVFPAASKEHVPEAWRSLMWDPESNIIDFYPVDFRIDLNGKKFAWQGVALLPFVDEQRLKTALAPLQCKLTQDEKLRNSRGDSFLYISVKHDAYKQLTDLYRMGMNMDTEVPVSGKDLQGMQGVVLMAKNNVKPDGDLMSPVAGLSKIKCNRVVTVRYRDPKYPEGYIFPAKRLKNAVPPPAVLGAGRSGIGFNPNLPQASLGSAGHRMVNHHSNQGRGGRHYQGHGGGQYHGHGGGQYQGQGGRQYQGQGSGQYQGYGNGGGYRGRGGGGHYQGSGGGHYQGRGGGGHYQGSGGGHYQGRGGGGRHMNQGMYSHSQPPRDYNDRNNYGGNRGAKRGRWQHRN